MIKQICIIGNTHRYAFYFYCIVARQDFIFPTFGWCQLSTINYRHSPRCLRKELANIRVSAAHSATNAIRLCLNFTERRVADCPDYVLLFRAKPHQTRVPSSIRQRIYNVYTSWSFETFLLRYPIKRHLSLKRALDAFSPVDVRRYESASCLETRALIIK